MTELYQHCKKNASKYGEDRQQLTAFQVVLKAAHYLIAVITPGPVIFLQPQSDPALLLILQPPLQHQILTKQALTQYKRKRNVAW